MRLDAAERFERGDGNRMIAADLRVTVRSVERWRRAWREGGAVALESSGPQSPPRLGERQFAQRRGGEQCSGLVDRCGEGRGGRTFPNDPLKVCE
ncbi:helix-turn-helix domain-containing protein [Kitasatospora sp. NPDC090308]|uniref:helix-turn-helix domain-containing protein n=1 Tax=Kitasatospora sp. NPDC090308 TaxID=3364082 RepID=UPI003822337C